jgi:hypothetical protein
LLISSAGKKPSKAISQVISVAVTADAGPEHQKFTNMWRQLMPYGVTNYRSTSKEELMGVAETVYGDYPAPIDLAREIIFGG